ncbi:MAG: hypothetical protein ABJA82_17220, partial [Myxococcales bacterium]
PFASATKSAGAELDGHSRAKVGLSLHPDPSGAAFVHVAWYSLSCPGALHNSWSAVDAALPGDHRGAAMSAHSLFSG